MNFSKNNRTTTVLGATLLMIILVISIIGCSNEVSNSNSVNTEGSWLIPETEVFGGGPGRDGIPALFKPAFVTASQVDFLASNDLVIGIRVGETVRAYPHMILDWHEIVNDQINQTYYSVTYCPLTGSAIGWNRNIGGKVTTFGVSGLLYNTNLIPYDRETASNWSQMKVLCVNGSLSGRMPSTFSLVETTWGSFKQMFPESEIITKATGFSRSYGSYPYGDYRTNNNRLLFPVNNDDSRLPGKERILGLVVGEKSKAYRLVSFTTTTTVIIDSLDGVQLVMVGNSSRNFAVAFERKATDGTLLSFEPVTSNGTAVMKDAGGTNYDLFGLGLDGPRKGERLESLEESYIAYWFAWGAFHPNSEIFGQ